MCGSRFSGMHSIQRSVFYPPGIKGLLLPTLRIILNVCASDCCKLWLSQNRLLVLLREPPPVDRLTDGCPLPAPASNASFVHSARVCMDVLLHAKTGWKTSPFLLFLIKNQIESRLAHNLHSIPLTSIH
jgi:hypothetical protein